MSSVHTHTHTQNPPFSFSETRPPQQRVTRPANTPPKYKHAHLPRDTMTPPILPPTNTHKPETHKQPPPPILCAAHILYTQTQMHIQYTNKLVLT